VQSFACYREDVSLFTPFELGLDEDVRRVLSDRTSDLLRKLVFVPLPQNFPEGASNSIENQKRIC
jgi:hypothetical protein